MTEFNFSNATSSDMTNAVKDVSVNPVSTDGTSASGESRHHVENWEQYFGYFNEIPELHSAFLMKSIWNVGKSYTADPETSVVLGHVIGWGKDTFRDVLFNQDLVKNIAGDSFAEVIREDDKPDGTLLNLKPLDPSSMEIVIDGKGILDHYEQISKIEGKKPKTFKPWQIFHLQNCRVADQVIGISRIKPMEKTILAMNEIFINLKKIMNHQARPWILWKLKTDNATKINELVAKIDKNRNLGEDTFIPDDDDAISYEVVQLNPSAIILEWMNSLNNKFYRAVGMPLVLFGQAGTTESGGKIEYLGHEQVFEHDQKYLEDQVWNQLYLRINLNPPTSLLENLQQDQSKDAAQGMEIQQNDVTAGSGK
jgi:hypothetical protein